MSLPPSGINKEGLPSLEQEYVFQQLLTAIEAVRITRQEQYHKQYHPQLKRFTQQELNDEVCPAYKNWLIGRSRRLPGRAALMQIADYLECSEVERNDILLAAQYLPEQSGWEDDAFRQALQRAQQIMETLPYPAIVVTHTLQVQAANKLYCRLFELPPLDTLPSHQRTMMHFLLSPDSRICSMINAEAHAQWQKHVIYGLQRFREHNILYQYDAWYQQSIQQWCDEVPDFQVYWEKARAVARQEVAPTKVIFVRMATTGEIIPIKVLNMRISVCSKAYPAVSALVPVDEAAYTVYASLAM